MPTTLPTTNHLLDHFTHSFDQCSNFDPETISQKDIDILQRELFLLNMDLRHSGISGSHIFTIGENVTPDRIYDIDEPTRAALKFILKIDETVRTHTSNMMPNFPLKTMFHDISIKHNAIRQQTYHDSNDVNNRCSINKGCFAFTTSLYIDKTHSVSIDKNKDNAIHIHDVSSLIFLSQLAMQFHQFINECLNAAIKFAYEYKLEVEPVMYYRWVEARCDNRVTNGGHNG